MHHIIPSLVHTLGMHAFVMATLGVLGVADVGPCLLHPSSKMPAFVKGDFFTFFSREMFLIVL